MMFHSRAAQTTLLATGSALVLLLAALDDYAHAEGNLDASYTISFARIRVGDMAATVVFGESEYAISARGRAGGIMKVLVDGEASFTTRGTVKDGHPVPTTFTSKIISNTEISDVTMVLDEGGVKELAAGPQPGGDRVPVTEANRQSIVEPLTAMLFSAAAAGEGLSPEACRQTLPIFDGHHRYDLKLRFKRMDEVTAEKGYAGRVVVCSVGYEPIAGHRPSTPLVKYLSEGREMEVALAPVAGTRLLAPFRVSVMIMFANLGCKANWFKAPARPLAVPTFSDRKPAQCGPQSAPPPRSTPFCRSRSATKFCTHKAVLWPFCRFRSAANFTSTKFSRARSPLISRCNSRPSSSSSSTCKPPRRSALPCRRRCSPALTR